MTYARTQYAWGRALQLRLAQTQMAPALTSTVVGSRTLWISLRHVLRTLALWRSAALSRHAPARTSTLTAQRTTRFSVVSKRTISTALRKPSRAKATHALRRSAALLCGRRRRRHRRRHQQLRLAQTQMAPALTSTVVGSRTLWISLRHVLRTLALWRSAAPLCWLLNLASCRVHQ